MKSIHCFVLRLAICCVAVFLAPQLASADPNIEKMISATVKLNGKESNATGFLVQAGDKIVVATAAHVFEKMQGDECTLTLRKLDANGQLVRLETKFPIRKGDQALWTRDPTFDVAAIAVTIPKDAVTTPFKLEQIANDEVFNSKRMRVAREVWLAGYPAMLEGDNTAGTPVLRRGTVASSPLKTDKTYLVNMTSFGGDSGGPVVTCDSAKDEQSSGDEPMVVGVVLGMQRQTDRQELPFLELTMHMPLGLSIITPAPILRKTIEIAVK